MAIKKTSKTSQSTPAKKTAVTKSVAAKPAAKASVKVAAPAKKPVASVRKVATPAAVSAPVAVGAPSVKRVASAPALTVITAAVDVGFGNTLYVRGDGPGLSWEKGVPLACVSAERWSLTIGEAGKPVAFKFLLNDVVWSEGEDFVVAPGASVVLTPVFV